MNSGASHRREPCTEAVSAGFIDCVSKTDNPKSAKRQQCSSEINMLAYTSKKPMKELYFVSHPFDITVHDRWIEPM